MTVLELFDKSSIDNLMTPLSYRADKVIYVGYDKQQLEKECRLFEKIFMARQMGVEVCPLCVSPGDDETILQCFIEIFQSERNLIVDLKGGDETLLLLLGRAYEIVHPVSAQMHCMDSYGGAIQFHSAAYFSQTDTPALSVRETVELHGGVIADCTDVAQLAVDPKQPCNVIDDLQTMWEICCRNPNRWNSNANCLAEIDSAGICNGLEVMISAKEVKRQKKLSSYDKLVNTLIPLYRAGLITMLDIASSHISFVYKNRCVRECLRRAGLLLELKIFTAALQCRDEKNNPVFHDAMTGVVLDWSDVARKDATVNEADVILMRGMIPYFVSCKSGNVDEDELYKFAAVARKFGGRHVRKLMVLQTLSGNRGKDRHFLNRAREMGIQVLYNVHKMDEIDLAEDLFAL